jgi:predicted enzyme related to lactoylglutathione lyase
MGRERNVRAMSERAGYLPGVPCWVETLQPGPREALDFYGPLFGWEFSEPGPMPGGGEYFVARLRGRDVAAVGGLPPVGGPAVPIWNTYVSVDDIGPAADRATAAGGTVVIGPLDALPAGRLAVVVDTAGAAFSLWEAGVRHGAELVNEPGTWTMSSLHTTDVHVAGEFYGAVFGWVTEAYGPVTLFRRPDYVGGLEGQPIPRDVVAVMAPPSAEVPPHWNVDLRVADVDTSAERAVTLGGTVILAPLDTPGLRSAVLADPQGAVFSVSSLAP